MTRHYRIVIEAEGQVESEYWFKQNLIYAINEYLVKQGLKPIEVKVD
jgi:hypothetical protein